MDNAIIVLLITSTTNLIFGLSKLIAKSKCSEIKLCGCIKITRDVEIEKEEDLLQPPSPKQNGV